MARNIQTVEVTDHELRTIDNPLQRRMRDRHGKLRRIKSLTVDIPHEGVRIQLAGGGWCQVLAGQTAEVTVLDPKCQCGCGTTTKGGFWIPGHDGRVAGIGKRALLGDAEALHQLAAIDPRTLPSNRPTEITIDSDVRCDASCQFAHRSLCVCSCGGTGHFKGWVAMGIRITQEVRIGTSESRRRWAEYSLEAGRQMAPEYRPTLQSEPGGDAADADWGEDVDAFIRSVIQPDGPIIEGDCPKGGQLLDLGEWITAGRPARVPCPDCEREVGVRPTGRLYSHQSAQAATADVTA